MSHGVRAPRTGSLTPHRASLQRVPSPPCPTSQGETGGTSLGSSWERREERLMVPPLKSQCPQELGDSPWQGSEGTVARGWLILGHIWWQGCPGPTEHHQDGKGWQE